MKRSLVASGGNGGTGTLRTAHQLALQHKEACESLPTIHAPHPACA